MADTLTYDLRAGMLHGFVGGSLISVPVDPASADVARWEHTYEFRAGKWNQTSDGKGYVLTSVRHSASRTGAGGRRRLTVAENAALEVFDYPGAYAQRFDGVDKAPAPGGPVPIPYPNFGAARTNSTRSGGDPDQPVIVGQVPNPIPWFDPNFQGGVFVATAAGARALIHPWPLRPGPGPTIVVTRGWEQILAAAQQTRQITLIADM